MKVHFFVTFGRSGVSRVRATHLAYQEKQSESVKAQSLRA